MNPSANTAQERGMLMVAAMVRQLTPPELETVILVYDPKRPEKVSSVMATVDLARTPEANEAALARARVAAQAFIATPPNKPGFTPRS